MRVHTPEYLARLEAFTRDGGGRIEQDTVVSLHSYQVARRAAGAACDAVSRVCGGKAKKRSASSARPVTTPWPMGPWVSVS